MAQNHKYLEVLNASAGSGKTYSLVKTYIYLLLTDEANTDSKYTEILAMTFTNKAALEMKTRIIKALDELANGKNDSYLKEIAEETALKEQEVVRKAKRLLSGILHRYEDFHVMTIDKFNLRLIRSFSRDLNLPPDFEVVLNETPILEQVVDGLLAEIGKDQQLTTLLLHYATINVEDEGSWDLRKSLIKFGKILSSEQDLPYVERLMGMEFSLADFEAHRKEMKGLNQAYNDLLQKVYKKFIDSGIEEKDLVGKSTTYKGLLKINSEKIIFEDTFFLTNATVTNVGKTLEKLPHIGALNTSVLDALEFYQKNCVYSETLGLYLKNYFNMALLKYMNHALTALNKQERLIRISEFNTKIAELLQEDTLYIYEKLGTRFRHFMLDEFQDTSRLQWMNLLPLIQESLGHGQKNFIVGDPKQAIYRFKNGVAEQFVALPGVYNPEKDPRISAISAFFEQMGVVNNLEDNWRSSQEIVTFNNQLFESLRQELDATQTDFYASVKQNPQSSKNGYIYVESYESKLLESELSDFENKYAFVRKSIDEAHADGFKLGDICILARDNSLCNAMATALTNEKYKVVSADSLNIDSELTVRFILSYFKLRLNPVNQNFIRQFFYLFCERFSHPLSYYNSLFEVHSTANGRTYKIANIDLLIGKNPSFEEHFWEPFETLYDLAQKSFRLFGLHELKNPYLHHLADLIHLFETRNGPDLNLFIQDYDTMSRESKALQIPESDDALKIMTIHKSKGLEFPVVIVLNSFRGNSTAKDIFVNTDNYLLRTTTKKESNIEERMLAYQDEKQKLLLDDLNLTYVAYTRPVHRLYLLNDFKKNTLGANIGMALSLFAEAVNKDNKLILKKGTKEIKVSKDVENEQEDLYFEPVSSDDNLWFPDIALQDSDELTTEDFLSDEQRYGNQFHLAISSIHGKEEIDKILGQLLHAGLVEKQFESNLKTDLDQLFSTDTYNALFENALEIYSEQSYIISKNEQMRPDIIIRKKEKTIVVDYKTGQELKSHRKQVKQYCSVLREMGYEQVEGYLFYTKKFELQKIE